MIEKPLIRLGAQTNNSSHPKPKCIRFGPANFETLSLLDLERLKDDKKWLSDSHITFSLLYVPFSDLFCFHLTEVGIVFKNVLNEKFGAP